MLNKSIKTAGNRGRFVDGVLATLPPRFTALWLQHGMFSHPFTVEAV
jgi:hypothetical protein